MRFWSRSRPSRGKNVSSRGRGLILFKAVQGALRAEKVLKKNGCNFKLVAPPPALRKGCDLAIEVATVEQIGIERVLRENEIETLGEIIPLDVESQKPLDIIKVTKFDNWVMVRAGNMKITFDKGSGTILNISGGGCPDVPYLHLELIDKELTKAPRPRDLGYTLCALMLDRAYEESLSIFKREKCY
ncbi:MAG: DUF3343 domain-containing protein [Actinomycetota bacterium]|nr:DUF3343 domain-containing protein [Actinomycetota bacterium]